MTRIKTQSRVCTLPKGEGFSSMCFAMGGDDVNRSVWLQQELIETIAFCSAVKTALAGRAVAFSECVLVVICNMK